ncbi:2-hydroxyacyl-CoA dehydratase family protein [bacterium]|nr:2-hydroxyacyl-CoA dehydratase family protein [bacterium]
MADFRVFHEIVDNPSSYAQKWKTEKNGKIIGTFCSYAPEEIILAAGALGYRIFGTGGAVSMADKYLQAYSCSLVRGAMEESLAGGLDFLDGVIFPHTCDSIQRLSDIWRMNIKTGFHIDLVMPVKLNTQSSRDYMIDVIKAFKQNLETQLETNISEQALEQATETCNQIRDTVNRIYAVRQKFPGKIKGEDIHAMVKASMMMDRHDFLSLVRDIADELEKSQEGSAFAGKRLVLSGGLCNMPDIYSVIENAGAYVVRDDLCTGNRFFEENIKKSADSLKSIANRYVDRNVCPAKHSGIRSRGENLVRIVQESKADGVLFIYLKFCDPHGFDYPYLKDMLEENKIPCMLYEIEDQLSGGGQFETRCEAFVEML